VTYNGNRYFNLGYALATSEKAADAIKNLAKADELGCSPENTVQLYNLLGIICFDIGRYKDALVNLEKAEQYRTALIEAVADESDELMELYLAGEPIPEDLLRSAIRSATINNNAVPTCCVYS